MSSKITCRNEEYQITEIEGELVLYHAGRSDTLFLNEYAAIVWYLCDGERSESGITQLLSESYPESAENMANEVKETIGGFIDYGGLDLK